LTPGDTDRAKALAIDHDRHPAFEQTFHLRALRKAKRPLLIMVSKTLVSLRPMAALRLGGVISAAPSSRCSQSR
jgi:hypothetical protein